jgi:hypothetical protein
MLKNKIEKKINQEKDKKIAIKNDNQIGLKKLNI